MLRAEDALDETPGVRVPRAEEAVVDGVLSGPYDLGHVLQPDEGRLAVRVQHLEHGGLSRRRARAGGRERQGVCKEKQTRIYSRILI